MCGIAGLVRRRGSRRGDRGDVEALLDRMATCLAHRGPDDSGYWLCEDAEVGLAHRRLAIVDLSNGGHQPMHSQDGRWVMVYNGEVYNHYELRAQLLRTGVRMRSGSDTEVLLEVISREGIWEGLQKVDGMFAFALWDREQQRLTLARDRMGEKPLYYGWLGGDLVFASELKALTPHEDFPPNIDTYATALFLRYGYVPTPYSAYEGIYKLPAGYMVGYSGRGTGEVDGARPFWSLDSVYGDEVYEDQEREGGARVVNEFEARVAKAVEKRMTSADVPVGAFLSGGVDSSFVVALMQAQSSSPIKTFTIGFGEGGYDESTKAQAVARELGAEHISAYVGAEEAQGVIPELPRLYDEPFADSSQIPTCLLAAITKDAVDVVLTGDGADELLGGYDRYGRLLQVAEFKQRVGSTTARALGRGLVSMPSAVGDVISRARPVREGSMRRALFGERTHRLGEMLLAKTESEMYTQMLSSWSREGGVRTRYGGPWADPARMGPFGEFRSMLDMMCFVDQVGYLSDDILVKVDRASMAVGLEARAPYLDHNLVEWSWSLPGRFKRRAGTGKWVLRQALSRYLPESVVEQPDHGFSAPIGDWLSGPLHQWGEELLSGQSEMCAGLLDPDTVRARWAEHVSGRRDWHQHLWHVLMFEAWARGNA